MKALAGEPFDDWIAEAGGAGAWDVLKHYGYFRRKFDRMLADIDQHRPDAGRCSWTIRDSTFVWRRRCASAAIRKESLLHQPAGLGLEPRPHPQNGAYSRL